MNSDGQAATPQRVEISAAGVTVYRCGYCADWGAWCPPSSLCDTNPCSCPGGPVPCPHCKGQP